MRLRENRRPARRPRVALLPTRRRTQPVCAAVGPRAGYGNCSLCECKAFLGSGDLCQNCYHNFDKHW